MFSIALECMVGLLGYLYKKEQWVPPTMDLEPRRTSRRGVKL